MSSDLQRLCTKTDDTICVYHPSIAEGEQGGSLELTGLLAFAKSVRDPVSKHKVESDLGRHLTLASALHMHAHIPV